MHIPIFILLILPFIACLVMPGIHTSLSLIIIILFTLPLIIFSKYSKVLRTYEPPRISNILIAIYIILWIYNINLILSTTQYSYVDLISLNAIQDLALELTQRRYNYSDSYEENRLTPYILALSFFMLYRVGLSNRYENKIKIALIFFPLVLDCIISTAKFPLYVGTIFYLSGMFQSRIKIDVKFCMKFLKIISAILIVFILAFVNRGYLADPITILYLLKNYLLNQFYIFGYWVMNTHGFEDCCFYGSLSFSGPLNYFGLSVREPGIFNVFVPVGDTESNIFTGYRYLIEDFSLIGPFFINTVLGYFFYLSGHFKKNKIQHLIYAYILISSFLVFATTVFVYNSIFLSFIMIVLYVLFFVKAEV